MKRNSLLLGLLLLAVGGGCNANYYGPASPDFYPSASPPFTNAAAKSLDLPKAVAAKPAPPSAPQAAKQAASQPNAKG